MTDIIKKKRGKKSEKNHELFSDSHWVYIGKEGREGLGSTQGPDTLAAFVRNSKACEDTHEPVRDGWHC
jgi:hypothetical protein